MMKAVSFMYVRPPGYNAESAKAAEIADASQPPAAAASSSSNSMYLHFSSLLVTLTIFSTSFHYTPCFFAGIPNQSLVMTRRNQGLKMLLAVLYPPKKIFKSSLMLRGMFLSSSLSLASLCFVCFMILPSFCSILKPLLNGVCIFVYGRFYSG
jgi:hypothetical protein